jgi:hypothetical protein
MKKVEKKLEFYWTKRVIVSILNALLVCNSYGEDASGVLTAEVLPVRADRVTAGHGDAAGPDEPGATGKSGRAGDQKQQDTNVDAAFSERDMLHKELIEILDRYKTLSETYRQTQLSIASTLASEQITGSSKREEQLFKMMATLTENGRKLALKSVEFCEYFDSILEGMPMGKIQKAAMRLRIDDLKSESRKYCTLTDPLINRQSVERCRLLAVNDSLMVAVLPIGTVHGVFNGLCLYDQSGKVKLKVITVLPYVSAAILETGSMSELAPGMEFSTNVKRN